MQTVLRATLTSHHNMFEHWGTYAVLAGYLATSFFWLARLNIALRDFDALFIVPLLQVCPGYYCERMPSSNDCAAPPSLFAVPSSCRRNVSPQVLWTIFSLVSGGIFFKEFADTPAPHLGMLFAGIGIVLWGVVLLAGTREPSDKPEWDEEGEGMPVSFLLTPALPLPRAVNIALVYSLCRGMGAAEHAVVVHLHQLPHAGPECPHIQHLVHLPAFVRPSPGMCTGPFGSLPSHL